MYLLSLSLSLVPSRSTLYSKYILYIVLCNPQLCKYSLSISLGLPSLKNYAPQAP